MSTPGAAATARGTAAAAATDGEEGTRPELSVVVPTRNERDNVAPLGARLESALAGIDWQVIFVDDDSPDLTATAVGRLASRDPRVRLIRHGLVSFYAVCALGAVANVALAARLYRALPVWWLAGTVGAALGAAWNYVGTRLVTWRRTAQAASDRPVRR